MFQCDFQLMSGAGPPSALPFVGFLRLRATVGGSCPACSLVVYTGNSVCIFCHCHRDKNHFCHFSILGCEQHVCRSSPEMSEIQLVRLSFWCLLWLSCVGRL